MRLASLPPLLRADDALTRVLGDPAGVVAVPESARAVAIAALAQLSDRRPLVVATPTGSDAGQLYDDLVQFLPDDSVLLFPAWETLPFERVSPNVETMGRRMEVIWRLRDPERCPRVVIAGVRALLQRLAPGAVDVEPVVVRKGDVLDTDALLARLIAIGYRREELVEHRSEVARRGAIIDIFPSTADNPVRIDLWGDEVDRLTEFAVNDQRSTDDIDEAVVFPARELLPSATVRARAAELVGAKPWGREQWERIAEGTFFDGMESWLPWLAEASPSTQLAEASPSTQLAEASPSTQLAEASPSTGLAGDDVLLTDVLPKGAKVAVIEPRRMRDRAGDLLDEEADLARALAGTWARDSEKEFPRLHAAPERLLAGDQSMWTIAAAPLSPDSPTVAASGWGPVAGDGSGLTNRLTQLLADGYRVVVAADGEGSAHRLAEILGQHGLDFRIADGRTDLTRPGGAVVVAPLHRGFTVPAAKLAVVAEGDLTGRRRAHRLARPRRRQALGAFENLKPGNYVVHHQHGVGHYQGMVKRTIGGVERDYLLISYKGGDKLYVPSDQIDSLRQYGGSETPTLHRLGGADFAKTTARVRSAVREIAQELVVLYQKRVHAEGFAFGADTPWQDEMEQAFPYVETPDQRTAIATIKADMERPYPMERLLCGDVGFGKTEVAIRAAFKAIQDGKQVAVLAPTTLLTTQHGNTFADRFAGYPIRVETLSRFLTAKEAREVLAGLKDGTVDCVIGTHRLLQEGVEFKDLGLLVVDEEQRFGVQAKEQMKKLRTNVDVLTLSATPIPRTLEMSLVGIRDLSLLQTPPADRQPILTFVGEFDERVAVEAIRRELLREGQVFWVHNRVGTIERTAAELRGLVPEARIAVAHGQMDEGSLEQIVLDFWEGRYDVLVCTTIIESGIDMPTVNTLVVERADLLGLGQMHQLRGRVGRSGSRAYAYLFHPRDVRMTEEAYERLRTIGEATDLGSGFKIAMRDLEIRGAGNLLGEAQSGHIAAVGYDLYCQMVSEAVGEMKGEPVKVAPEIKIDVPTDAFLPEGYVAKSELRLEAYRRLASVTTLDDVLDIAAEWEDRYGPVPAPAAALLDVARLRAECHRLGLRDLQIVSHQARLGPIELKTSEELRLRRLSRNALVKVDPRHPEAKQLVVPVPSGVAPAAFLVHFLGELFPSS